MSEEEEGEWYIGEDPSPELEIPDDEDDNTSEYDGMIASAAAYLPSWEFSRYDDLLTITVPLSAIPENIVIANSLFGPFLCKVEIKLAGSLSTPPTSVDVHTPSGRNFAGTYLIKEHIRAFFSDYSPGSRPLRSAVCVLKPEGVSVSQEHLETLLSKGYSRDAAEIALMRAKNDISIALDFLKTGDTSRLTGGVGVDFRDSPFVYLAIEIVDAFYDMTDHCCMCGRFLGISGVKPMVCERKLCLFQFIDLGLGSNVVGEIARDPEVADLIISLASIAFGAGFLQPAPHDVPDEKLKAFFQTLPPMKGLAALNDDADLADWIGKEHVDILRFFLLANRALLATLRGDKKLKQLPYHSRQFLILATSPEREAIFQRKKNAQGQAWLWHGSRSDRWYSILHHGLKDYSGTSLERNGGAWYGKGVYQSESFVVSLWYAANGAYENEINGYVNSTLGKNFHVVGLVENAKGKALNNVHPHEYTQKDEQALVVRVLMVIGAKPGGDWQGSGKTWDTLADPPRSVPTLKDIADLQQRKR